MEYPNTPEDVATGISTSGDKWAEERWVYHGPAVDVVRSFDAGEINAEEATNAIIQGNLGAMHGNYTLRYQYIIGMYRGGSLDSPKTFMKILKRLFHFG